MSKRLHAYEFLHPVCVCVCVCVRDSSIVRAVSPDKQRADRHRERQTASQHPDTDKLCLCSLSVRLRLEPTGSGVSKHRCSKQTASDSTAASSTPYARTHTQTHTPLHKQIHTQKSRRIKTKWLHCGFDGCVSHEDIKHTKVLT